MMLLLIFLGIFVDQVSMMMITLPIFMPVVQAFGIDLVWFGVMFLICMQLGLLLPPHGLLLMTMKGVAPPQVTMAHIFRRSCRIVAMSLLLLALVFFVPAVAVWLPKAARDNGKIFKEEVEKLKLGDGEIFHGEASSR